MIFMVSLCLSENEWFKLCFVSLNNNKLIN